MSIVSSFSKSGVSTVSLTRGMTSDHMKSAIDENFSHMNVGFRELHGSHAHVTSRQGKTVLQFVPKNYFQQSVME